MKIKIKQIVISSILTSLFTIFLLETFLESEYRKLKLKIAQKKVLLFNSNNFKNCLPDQIYDLPVESTVVIGHAYGSPSNNGISPKVDQFLENFKNKISTVIFNGDVIENPSLLKWETLFDKHKGNFNIYVSPGNHDVGYSNDNSRRDVFNIFISQYQPLNMPLILKENDSTFVLYDSSKIPKSFDKLIKRVKPLKNENIFIIMHHVAIPQLNRFANQSREQSQQYDKYYLEDNFKDFENVNFIYGDGGGESRPNISCYKHKQITHILNGIGDKEGDSLVVISNGKIYKYEL